MNSVFYLFIYFYSNENMYIKDWQVISPEIKVQTSKLIFLLLINGDES